MEMDKKNIISIIRDKSKSTLATSLGIEICDLGKNYVSGKMPVNHKTKQPFGLLHGGASVAFAETLGSIGAGMQVDLDDHSVVGIEINASHVRPVKDGYVNGKAQPLRIGRSIQVWDIKITNEKGDLVCSSRLTLSVIAKNKKKSNDK